MENSTSIIQGLYVPSQVPLDPKRYSKSENDLKYLGQNSSLAFSYHDGLIVRCLLERTDWEWREVFQGGIPLLSSHFVYPNNIVVGGINYSNKSFNFFKVIYASSQNTEEPEECTCGTIYPFGTLVLKSKGVNNCVANTGTQLKPGQAIENGKLEIGDLVEGWENLNNYWILAKYLGGNVKDTDNSFEVLLNQDMGTTCSIAPLDIDATVSAWSAWSTCANSLQTRTRTVITPASGTGTTPSLSETQACVMPVVNADAVMSAWSAWSSCVDDLQTRTRTVVTPATGTGTTPALSESRACVEIVDNPDYTYFGTYRKDSPCGEDLDIYTLNSTGYFYYRVDNVYSLASPFSWFTYDRFENNEYVWTLQVFATDTTYSGSEQSSTCPPAIPIL